MSKSKWIDNLYDYLAESNANFIGFIGKQSTWNELCSYADNIEYINRCLINNTMLYWFNPNQDKYHGVQFNGKRPDVLISEYDFKELPYKIESKLSPKYKKEIV